MSIIVLHTNLPVHDPDRRVECRRFSLMLMVKSGQGVTVRRGLLAFFKPKAQAPQVRSEQVPHRRKRRLTQWLASCAMHAHHPSPTAQGVAPLRNPATREIAFRLTGRPTPVLIKRVAQPRGRKADSVRGGATGVHYHRDLPVAT